ncbi:hypothetical protein L2E82_11023 [Cichorium intybus]|uniref:Uncharacterized protein n=1 Tax=Cichorium intybus TaxID=13427 RepID=A0ACB9GC53_CICIN|nr:hypothetical protein L2E82_11023 [Cichorium intybus]
MGLLAIRTQENLKKCLDYLCLMSGPHQYEAGGGYHENGRVLKVYLVRIEKRRWLVVVIVWFIEQLIGFLVTCNCRCRRLN